MLKELIPGIRITLVLTVLTGLLYPGLVTGLCQLVFRQQANGSLIVNDVPASLARTSPGRNIFTLVLRRPAITDMTPPLRAGPILAQQAPNSSTAPQSWMRTRTKWSTSMASVFVLCTTV
jgi:hypothetical protein